ncbi:MAG: hypothetical protein KDD25_03355 [Bdellovibrionales bacterium]|nr:hypothetical protein [Bdellovibrionales bacterium]
MSPKRHLSEFLCRELLYDYAIGDLDPIRKVAVQESLESFPELEDELKALEHGIRYLNKISETEISEPLYHRVIEDNSWFSKINNFKSWPNWVRWSLEAGLVAGLVVLTISLVPDEFWMKDTSRWEIGSTELGTSQAELEMSDETDEEAEITQKEEEGPTPTGSEDVASAKISGDESETAATEPGETKSTEATATTRKADKRAKGYVIRMYMFSDRVDEITPLIVEKIENIGGKKAGEVRLGWRKKQGSYFHFSIPEDKNSEFTRFISQFGDVRISKDEHPRVMPEGTERYILWVEEVNARTNDGDEESPENP